MIEHWPATQPKTCIQSSALRASPHQAPNRRNQSRNIMRISFSRRFPARLAQRRAGNRPDRNRRHILERKLQPRRPRSISQVRHARRTGKRRRIETLGQCPPKQCRRGLRNHIAISVHHIHRSAGRSQRIRNHIAGDFRPRQQNPFASNLALKAVNQRLGHIRFRNDRSRSIPLPAPPTPSQFPPRPLSRRIRVPGQPQSPLPATPAPEPYSRS